MVKMRALGRIINFSPNGSMVVKAQVSPEIGRTVMDRKQRPLGRIVRVAGPVKAPYVIVLPTKELEGPMNRLLGAEVFLGEHLERSERMERSGQKRQERPPYRREGSRRPWVPTRRNDRGRPRRKG